VGAPPVFRVRLSPGANKPGSVEQCRLQRLGQPVLVLFGRPTTGNDEAAGGRKRAAGPDDLPGTLRTQATSEGSAFLHQSHEPAQDGQTRRSGPTRDQIPGWVRVARTAGCAGDFFRDPCAFSYNQMHMIRVENGKGVEHWAVRDNAGLMKQLTA
jgi:SnoaL-like polyketide cyclase